MQQSFIKSIEQAALAISQAEAVIILAGAGMGVDSGLPDFRGKEGFWKAYPMLEKSGRHFSDMANPQAFEDTPNLAWGFYGHRLNLYRQTQPHAGFEILKRWAQTRPGGYFVYTSNVDGQFQKSGFDCERVFECHGSIHYLQTLNGKGELLAADDFEIEVDLTTLKAQNLIHHPQTTDLLRPNVLMFNDWHWNASRSDEQLQRYQTWLRPLKSRKSKKVAIIELGAGSTLPAVRSQSAMLRNWLDSTYIQINPQLGHKADIGIGLGALDALTQIEQVLK
ncbi:MAG: Sir2 family NAD-dependent protein deacetylase [Thiomicrospira sp.]